MLLSQLQKVLMKSRVVNMQDVEIQHITSDSRKVEPGSLFIALRGYTVDGHSFVSAAAKKGAVAALVEEPVEGVDLPQLVVPDTRLASAIVADVFLGHPSARLKMIGVTGTNGKTTTTNLIERVLSEAGAKVGIRGTLGKKINGVTVELANTTPEAVELQSTLKEMVDAGCHYGVIEVSSHALEEKRDAGVRYHIAVFTNLTQDHLDYHGTMENYRRAKGKLFARLGNGYGDDIASMSFAVLNADDDASRYFQNETVAQCVTYGIDSPADVRAVNVRVTADGVRFRVMTFRGESDVRLQLTGRFNVYNALAAISVGLIEQIPLDVIVRALEQVPGVAGRFERVVAGQPFTVLVDYSHTPDSLEKALETIREFAVGKVITVFGCGGDRDRTKRPLMAKVAMRLSDVAILTSDNPRTEDPEAILDDMEAGIKEELATPSHKKERFLYHRIVDRREAIRHAVVMAQPNDVILIAGKGHENYQIIGRTKHHFDDREVAREAILSRYQ